MHYEIVVDERRRSLRAELRGFWTLQITQDYLAALATAATQVSRGGFNSWWLIDMGPAQVQSREVAQLMSDTLPSLFPPNMTLAIIANASLAAAQAKRVVPNENHRRFTTLAEGERWLAEMGLPA